MSWSSSIFRKCTLDCHIKFGAIDVKLNGTEARKRQRIEANNAIDALNVSWHILFTYSAGKSCEDTRVMKTHKTAATTKQTKRIQPENDRRNEKPHMSANQHCCKTICRKMHGRCNNGSLCGIPPKATEIYRTKGPESNRISQKQCRVKKKMQKKICSFFMAALLALLTPTISTYDCEENTW